MEAFFAAAFLKYARSMVSCATPLLNAQNAKTNSSDFFIPNISKHNVSHQNEVFGANGVDVINTTILKNTACRRWVP